jgi:acid phosphatase (class A)
MPKAFSHLRTRAVAIFIGIAVIAGCSKVDQPVASVQLPESRNGRLPGYLPKASLPNSVALLPPPPGAGSAAFAADKAVNRQMLALRGTPRWNLARTDADLSFPNAARVFSCALNAPITAQDTPSLYRLLRRSIADAGASISLAKDRYKRTRPFVSNKAPICTPEERERRVTDPSYPSGHATTGWAWALILTELAPDRTDEILARGEAFGQSRVVCNVHWPSDVQEGRVMGAATVARLHADPTFLADLGAARAELDAARSKGLPPSNDCAAEQAALASPTPPSP